MHTIASGLNFRQHLVNVVRCETIVKEVAKLASAFDLKIAYQFKRDERLLGKAVQCRPMGVAAPFSCPDMCDSKRQTVFLPCRFEHWQL